MLLMVEYIKKGWNIHQYQNELRRLIKQYNEHRNSQLFIYACPTDKNIHQASLIREDYYVIHDFLRNSTGDVLDVYLETPGGRGDVAEDIVKAFRARFETVNFIIAGESKSAGTIIALSGNDIYMTETGSLGPIDAQLKIGRQFVSTSAYLEWVDSVKIEAEKAGKLNPFDATVVAQISPGELNGVIHQNKYAQDLVIEWLPKYKFKSWNLTESSQKTVTEQMKVKRAKEIAKDLAANSEKWRFHGRSIKIDDLIKEIRLKIERVEDDPKMSDLVYRIQTICRLLFDIQGIFKIFADSENAFFKVAQKGPPAGMSAVNKLNVAKVELECKKCGQKFKFYVKLVNDPNIDNDMKKEGLLPLPQEDFYQCQCGQKHDLRPIKQNLAKQAKKLQGQT